MKEFELPSGQVLKVDLAPFADSKELYQAVLEELKNVSFSSASDIASLFKDIACVGFSSKKIEIALDKCFKRCLYGEAKIDKSTFEAADNRQDYVPTCVYVVKENIEPFLNGLFAQLKQFSEMMTKSPQSKL